MDTGLGLGLGFGLYVLLMLFLGLLSLACTAFWIWMIIDCATKEPSEGNDKIIWIIVIVLVGFLGAVVYYFARRPQRIAQLGR